MATLSHIAETIDVRVATSCMARHYPAADRPSPARVRPADNRVAARLPLQQDRVMADTVVRKATTDDYLPSPR